LEFADCRRSETQRKNVKHAVGLVSSLPTPGNTQYGDCLRDEGACAKETFEGVEFPSLEIECVPTKELLHRVKDMERREMELIRMWREAEKVDHGTEERWKGMVRFVQRELQELRRLVIKEMGDEMVQKFKAAVQAAEGVVPKPAEFTEICRPGGGDTRMNRRTRNRCAASQQDGERAAGGYCASGCQTSC
jgi:hypothetical protein